MAKIRQIKRRIKAAKNISQITRAMEIGLLQTLGILEVQVIRKEF
jgi:hypothetical protein